MEAKHLLLLLDDERAENAALRRKVEISVKALHKLRSGTQDRIGVSSVVYAIADEALQQMREVDRDADNG